MKRVETAIIENTGGWVMVAFGKLTTGEWFAASLDDDIIELYSNKQDAYLGDGSTGLIRTIYGDDADYKSLMIEIFNVAEDPWGVVDDYREMIEMEG